VHISTYCINKVFELGWIVLEAAECCDDGGDALDKVTENINAV
jgi:hypothetical protein